MQYTFSTLNDRDLEELARDLLSKKIKVQFQSFKPGKDKGIDLRYSSPEGADDIVVQVKHYHTSGYKSLKRDLIKKELPKVARISPQRYILVTSVPLSEANKNELKASFQPYIQSIDDIIGAEGLNSLLLEFKEVEHDHFKLWLSSTNVLEIIVKNGIHGRSKLNEHRIKDKVRLYVVNESHKKAAEILNKRQFLLVTGNPGIGKTTLAEILTCQLLADGFQLVFTSDTEEAEEAFKEGKRQVFYMDDFLGTITRDLLSEKNEDAKIISFVERVRNDKSKRLILTCRTAILNKAKELSEIIETSKIRIAEYEVTIEAYDEMDKARILYNHIYQSTLPQQYKEAFLKDKFYWKIIKHRNYNPRLIEFLTDGDGQFVDLDDNFQSSVLNLLDNPEKVWKKAFHQQTSPEGQLFLTTLFSFGARRVERNELEKAFQSRLQHEVTSHNFRRSHNLFINCVKELSGSAIVLTHRKEEYGSVEEYGLINPSLEDYLANYFATDGFESYVEMVKSFLYLEQFISRVSTDKKQEGEKIIFTGNRRRELYEICRGKTSTINSIRGSNRWASILVLIRLFDYEEVKEEVEKFYSDFESFYVSWAEFETIAEVLQYLATHRNDILFEHLQKYLLLLSGGASSYWLLKRLQELLENNEEMGAFMNRMGDNDPIEFQQIQNNIDRAWERDLDYYFEKVAILENDIEMAGLKRSYKDAITLVEEMNKKMALKPSPIFKSFAFDFEKQLEINKAAKNQEGNIINAVDAKPQKDPDAINALFNMAGPDNYDFVPF